jgi:hypothetical protein
VTSQRFVCRWRMVAAAAAGARLAARAADQLATAALRRRALSVWRAAVPRKRDRQASEEGRSTAGAALPCAVSRGASHMHEAQLDGAAGWDCSIEARDCERHAALQQALARSQQQVHDMQCKLDAAAATAQSKEAGRAAAEDAAARLGAERTRLADEVRTHSASLTFANTGRRS